MFAVLEVFRVRLLLGGGLIVCLLDIGAFCSGFVSRFDVGRRIDLKCKNLECC